MCQMSVFLEQNGLEESIMENVSKLEVKKDTVTVSTLFEEPKAIPDAKIQSIDFLAGKVILTKEG